MKLIKSLIVLSLLAPAVILYADESPAPQAITIDHFTLTPKFENRTEKDTNLTVDMQYPEFTGENLPEKEMQFNRLVGDMADSDPGDFSSQVFQMMQDAKKYGDSLPTTGPASSSSYTMRYKILMTKAGSNPLLSLLFTVDTFMAGNAYPNETHRTINFDFDKGDALNISDLFKPNADFTSALDNYCAPILEKTTGQTKQEMKDAGELTYIQWNLTPKGLLIHFDQFAHALGPQEVLVPYSALRDVLNPSSPVQVCLKDEAACQ